MFSLGQVLATPGVLQSVPKAVPELLKRHAAGDWGDVCDEDREANEDALKTGARLLSVYHVGETKVWIITEAADESGHRAATTLLLPEEY